MKNKIIAAVIAALALPLAWAVSKDEMPRDVVTLVDTITVWGVAALGALGGWIGVSIYQNSERHREAERRRLEGR